MVELTTFSLIVKLGCHRNLTHVNVPSCALYHSRVTDVSFQISQTSSMLCLKTISAWSLSSTMCWRRLGGCLHCWRLSRVVWPLLTFGVKRKQWIFENVCIDCDFCPTAIHYNHMYNVKSRGSSKAWAPKAELCTSLKEYGWAERTWWTAFSLMVTNHATEISPRPLVQCHFRSSDVKVLIMGFFHASILKFKCSTLYKLYLVYISKRDGRWIAVSVEK